MWRVQLHVDVRMRQKAGTQTTKIKSAKSFVMVHPRKFIPSKITRYMVVYIYFIELLYMYSTGLFRSVYHVYYLLVTYELRKRLTAKYKGQELKS